MVREHNFFFTETLSWYVIKQSGKPVDEFDRVNEILFLPSRIQLEFVIQIKIGLSLFF